MEEDFLATAASRISQLAPCLPMETILPKTTIILQEEVFLAINLPPLQVKLRPRQ